MTVRRILAAALLFGALARPAPAQQAISSAGGVDLLRHTLAPGRPDTPVVTLRKHGQYRITVYPATISARASFRGLPDFQTTGTVLVGAASRTDELYPQDNGIHRIVVELPAGSSTGEVRVWEDQTTEARSRARSDRRWRIGFAVAGGIVTGYQAADTATYNPPVPLDAPASHFIEAALLVRSQSPISFAAGIGNDPRPAGFQSVNWIFAEILARVARIHLAGHDLVVHLTGRFSQGNSSFAIDDRNAIGVGVLAEWHLDRGAFPRGVMLTAQAQLASYQHLAGFAPTIGRLSAGVSWIP